MLNPQRAITNGENNHDQDNDHDQDDEPIRDIHALTPPHQPPVNRGHRRETWETSSHPSSSLSETSLSENFTTMSREFYALVLAGSNIESNESDVIHNMNNNNTLMARIGEDEIPEETNPLAIVPDNNRLDSAPESRWLGSNGGSGGGQGEVSVQRVKKEKIETKISAWQDAEIAKINNRFKREEAVIKGRESEQMQKANTWMKKVERKLEEKRARAVEKMQNDVAKAHRKAEERRASYAAKRGTKLARIFERANLMRAVGRAPAKRSFF